MHIAVSGEVVDAAKRKVAMFGVELKDALERSSTNIEMESHAAVSRFQTKLSVMIVNRYTMLRLVKIHCLVTWRKFVVVCRRRPIW